jgi:3-methyladenine DNA glycosylase AlkD
VATPTPRADLNLIAAIKAGLAAAADPAQAAPMQRYMKSEMPYWGVKTAPQRRIFKAIFDEHRLADRIAWRDTVLLLWRGAGRREERYAAINLTGHRFYREYQDRESLPIYEEMVVTGAWWDYVDGIASHRIGGLLATDRGWMTAEMRRWSVDVDLWKRRTSIICQLGFKADTDLELLYGCIEPNVADTEFFIRKAIGWALRQYAWIDPDEIVRYVTANADRLSGLSKREALKNVLRSGAIDAIP